MALLSASVTAVSGARAGTVVTAAGLGAAVVSGAAQPPSAQVAKTMLTASTQAVRARR